MLDVPNFFWESEPTLYPLYIAVREYLEIKPRIQVLNERCRVFLDLTEILSDSIADTTESRKSILLSFSALGSLPAQSNARLCGIILTDLMNKPDQTWIIIILIIISILVTTGEVFLRFGILSSNHSAENPTGPSFITSLMLNMVGRGQSSAPPSISPYSSTGGGTCVCPGFNST